MANTAITGVFFVPYFGWVLYDIILYQPEGGVMSKACLKALRHFLRDGFELLAGFLFSKTNPFIKVKTDGHTIYE